MRFLVLAIVVGCGAGAHDVPVAEAPLAPRGEPPAAASRTPTPPPAPTPAAAADPVLTRSALNAALDAGPGAFLAKVSVHAVRRDGRFFGWEVESLWPGAQIGILPGDVVVGVNGRSLERPESLPALYQALRRAPEVVVDFRRGLDRREARFPVVEDAGKMPGGAQP